MSASLWIVWISLALAILGAAMLEWKPLRRREKLRSSLAYVVVVCCGLILVGVISGLLVHFFQVREWLAIVVALVPGFLLLAFFVWAEIG